MSTSPDLRIVAEPGRGWFGIIERQAIHRGTFPWVRGLMIKIRAFINGWNDRCQPFVWPKHQTKSLRKPTVKQLRLRSTSELVKAANPRSKYMGRGSWSPAAYASDIAPIMSIIMVSDSMVITQRTRIRGSTGPIFLIARLLGEAVGGLGAVAGHDSFSESLGANPPSLLG
jgi:hypothetical protein